jgi:hypothetical protein
VDVPLRRDEEDDDDEEDGGKHSDPPPEQNVDASGRWCECAGGPILPPTRESLRVSRSDPGGGAVVGQSAVSIREPWHLPSLPAAAPSPFHGQPGRERCRRRRATQGEGGRAACSLRRRAKMEESRVRYHGTSRCLWRDRPPPQQP